MAELNLTIKCSNADKATVIIDAGATVLDLKEKIAESLTVPSVQQRLIYKGRVLKDELTLEHYQILDGHTVHMVKGSAPASSGNSGTAPASAAPSVPAAAPAPLGGTPGGNTNANSMINMMNAMGGMGGFGGMGQQNPPDITRMQQQLMQNPEMMQQIMNSPMMENLLNNPDLMANMMTSNPHMQAMLDANPQMRHMLNDPAIIRQSMEMMRNPNAMREAQRSQDLAMSQLENIPGGFNAMRRMYEEVQEPMMEAAQNARNTTTAARSAAGSGATPSSSGSTPTATAPSNAAMPNPWGGGGSTPTQGAAVGGGTGGVGGAPGISPFGMMNPMDGMGNNNPMAADPAAVAQMMQNPMMQQMMQQMLNDPNIIQQLSAQNPQMGAILQNPQMRAMLTNPQMLQQLSNPQAIQDMMRMQESMRSLQRQGLLPAGGLNGNGQFPFSPFGGAAATGSIGGFGGTPYTATTPPPAVGGLNFDALLGSPATTPAGTGQPGTTTGAVPPRPSPPQDPAVRYANQLQQLRGMGFADDAASLQALIRCQGNVNAAVERLLGGP